MSSWENEDLLRGLTALGDKLAEEGQTFACIVAGGAALDFLGVLERATADVDVLSIRDVDGIVTIAHDGLPRFVVIAAESVASALNLPVDWLNAVMARGFYAGLPEGYDRRVTWRRFHALDIGFLAREDLIAFKLDAARDNAPRVSKHHQDLVALDATEEELRRAAVWVMRINVHPTLAESIESVIAYVADQRPR